jgi:hypothetical protein
MKKQLTLALMTIVSLACFTACNKTPFDGPVVKEERSVSHFTSIVSEIPGDIIISQEATQKVQVQAQENIIDDIKTEVVNGELRIYLRNRPRLTTGRSLKVYVAAPIINKMVLDGSGNMEANNPIDFDGRFHIDLKGSGNVDIAHLNGESINAVLSGSGKIDLKGGSVDYINLHLKGSGNLNARHLSSMDAHVLLSGSGNVRVWATDNLDATLTGSGNIYYYGHPRVHQNVTGSGKIKQAD